MFRVENLLSSRIPTRNRGRGTVHLSRKRRTGTVVHGEREGSTTRRRRSQAQPRLVTTLKTGS